MTNQSVLWELAVQQDGYVTSLDARDVGIPAIELAKLASRGKLRRAAQGLYRFDRLPAGRADHYRFATLWTGSRDAVLSHETALDLLELCDINPERIHVTVPKRLRVRRAEKAEITLHHEDLINENLAWWDGIRCVNEFTAVRQGIDTGVPVQLLRHAIETASARGRITSGDERFLLERLGTR